MIERPSDAELGELVTVVLQGVDGVERFYRPSGVGSALKALTGSGEPTAEVTSHPDRLEVVAHLGVTGEEPTTRTLREAADAVLASLDALGAPGAEVTVRVSRIL